jgi:hypothetical protein
MATLRRGRWAAGAVLAAAITLLAALVPWYGAAEGGQNAEPRAGLGGQRFDFFATGFDDGEPVGFWSTRPDGLTIETGAGQVFANDDGRADWFWVAPLDAMPGTWLIVAQGVDSGELRTFRIELFAPGQPAPQPPAPQQPAPEPQQPAPQQPAEPITVSPPGTFIPQGFTLEPQGATVRAGERIQFVGTGFVRGERVAAWATGPDTAVIGLEGVGAQGESGRAELSFELPQRAIGGQWLFTFKGDASQAPVTVVFYVIERDPARAESQIVVSPQSAAFGSTFQFLATGFDDGERVGYWITDPVGRVYTGEGLARNGNGAADTTVKASDRGLARVSWQANIAGPAGIWVLTMQGVDSGAARAIPFEIR